MAVKLPAPENLCILPGDRSGLSSWDKVDGADGYILEYYMTDNPKVCLQKIYTQIARKNIQGLLNGIEYFGTISAFCYDENGLEQIGFKSSPFYFIPISRILTAQKTICLEEGESTYIDWDYQNTVPEVTFTSADTSIAVVLDDGEVTGFEPGDTTITIEMVDTLDTFTVNVHVGRKINRNFVNKSTLLFTGDLMCPPKTQRMCRDGGYDFSNIFSESVRKLFHEADYVGGILKTMCDDSSPYESEVLRLQTGTANLNTPSPFIDALKNAGYDGIFTASDHNCDCGLAGLKATRKHVFHSRMNHIGSLGDNPVTKVINGLRFAFINLSQTGTAVDNQVSDHPYSDLGRYNETYFDELMKKAREKKADQIVVIMNWGQKNSRVVTSKQRMTAEYIAESGADIILGSGSHVMQAYEEFNTSDGRVVPCLYSLGNFYSGMTDLYENSVGAIAKVEVSEDSETYSCRLSLIPTLVTSQDGLTTVTTVDPIVTGAKQKAHDYLHKHYPPILFSSTALNTVSLQGSYILKDLASDLDCTSDYSKPDIEHLIQFRGDYCIIDVMEFVNAVNPSDQLAEYINQLSAIYSKERIILLRHNFSEYAVSESDIIPVAPVTELNHKIFDLEEIVIEKLHPIVIDISEYYMRNAADDNMMRYEDGFYIHASRIINKILAGNFRRFYYNDCDYQLWLDRVVGYRHSIMQNPKITRTFFNNYEAADIIIQEKDTYFLVGFLPQLLKLKELHAELPYVEKVFKDDLESEPLVKAAKEIQKKFE